MNYIDRRFEKSKIKEEKEDNLSEKLIRNFENTDYYGYMFLVKYRGSCFDSFDENPGKKSVKSEFRKILENSGIGIYKGIQQAGRTDRHVNAEENILYINSKNNIIPYNIKAELNKGKDEGLEIIDIKKTMPFLEFPDMVEKRFYSYKYPENLIKNDTGKIRKLCNELSGKTDFKKFTSKKGEKLKNHIRDIRIKYEEGKLCFEGDGFLPQQVRIMSNFILNNKMTPLEGKYLTLDKVEISGSLKDLIFGEVTDMKIKKVSRIEKNRYFYIFYVDSKNKSEIIGKKGKNIRQMKRIYGNIVVKEENGIL